MKIGIIITKGGNILTYLALLCCLIFGYMAGILQKGIKIDIHTNKAPEAPKKPKYNQSMADFLDPDTRNYLDQHNGQVKF